MKKSMLGSLAAATLLFAAAPAAPAAVTIGLTGDPEADNWNLANATTLAASYGPGSSASRIDATTFNSLSVAQLLSTYDLLVMGWFGSTSYNFDWTTRLLPYITGGGAVIFEDPENLSDLAGSGLTFGFNTSAGTYSGVFGPNDFTTSHFSFTTSGSWDCFYTSATAGNCLAASNTFGSGAIIVSGPDEFWHDLNIENDAFLKAEADFVLAAVPEPSVLALLALAFAGFGFSVRKKTG